MAKVAAEQQSSRRRQNRFLAMLIVGAALVSSVQDLDHARDLTNGLFGMVSTLQQTMRAAVTSPAEPACPQALARNDDAVQPLYWNGRVAPDQLLGIGGGNIGQPERRAVRSVAVAQAESEAPAADSLFVTSARVAAVCPASANSEARQSGKSVAAGHPLPNQSPAARQRMRFDLDVQLPDAIAYVGRAISESTKAGPVRSQRISTPVVPVMIPRVAARFMTRRVYVSAIADRQAELGTKCREIKMKLRDVQANEAIEFKANNGRATLDLIHLLKARIQAENLSGESLSGVPLSLTEIMQGATAPEAAESEESH